MLLSLMDPSTLYLLVVMQVCRPGQASESWCFWLLGESCWLTGDGCLAVDQSCFRAGGHGWLIFLLFVFRLVGGSCWPSGGSCWLAGRSGWQASRGGVPARGSCLLGGRRGLELLGRRSCWPGGSRCSGLARESCSNWQVASCSTAVSPVALRYS